LTDENKQLMHFDRKISIMGGINYPVPMAMSAEIPDLGCNDFQQNGFEINCIIGLGLVYCYER
jgi:hypothetical protein